MEEKTVRDIMLPLDEYAVVSSDSSLVEALAALEEAQRGLAEGRYKHRAILVRDKAGVVVGKLTHWSILRALEPGHLAGPDVASLTRAGLNPELIATLGERLSKLGGGLTRMCRHAAHVTAGEAMAPLGDSIPDDTLLSEAIHQVVQRHQQSALVTRAGRVVGVLRMADLFQELAEQIGGR